jgi:glycerophosphoryl diester phosphodiesterase
VQTPAKTLVLGHRGAPREAPENTMRAFEVALEQGADGVELDVQPAGDGTAVVIHDDRLDRTTDRHGPLAALTWGDIVGARSRGEPVPRLEQAVEWAVRSGAWLNVEVKSTGVEAESVRIVREAGLMERTFFSSFLPEVVTALRRAAPDGTVCYLTERWDAEVQAGVRMLGMDGVCLHHSIATPEAVAWLRDHRLHCVVWTVDDPQRMRELYEQGVLAIISNLPRLAAEVRAEVTG